MLRVGFRSLAAALLVVAAPSAFLSSTAAVNVDQDGLAMRGYDPVAYFDTGKPTKGLASLDASFDGARYLFASEEHRQQFMADPAKYVPQFGGFCAIGTSFGEKVDADPETGRVVNGRLYVNFNEKAQALFDKDVPGTIQRAEQNWPTVKDKAQ